MNVLLRYMILQIIGLLLLTCVLSCRGQQTVMSNYAGKNWMAFAGDDSKSRYSTLRQVNKENVKKLHLVWTYRSGDSSQARGTIVQCNPLVVEGTMYGTTPGLKLVALNGATGNRLWQWDPFAQAVIKELGTKESINIQPGLGYWVNRGVVWWQKGNDTRIYYSCGPYLFALQAATGKIVTAFGNEGKVDIRQGLGRNVKGMQ